MERTVEADGGVRETCHGVVSRDPIVGIIGARVLAALADPDVDRIAE